jgi:1-acyl-sn-glycerol-3-phosphate acyltransferase
MAPSNDREWNAWWRVARIAGRPVLGAAFRLRFSGLEHIPAKGGALVASNHISVLDPVLVALATARRGRTVRYLTVSDVFDTRIVGLALRHLDQIPLRRGAGDWAVIEEVADVIRRGSLAGISAEGTVGDGTRLLPIQKGAARIALAASASVIPVGVWGTHLRWAKSGPRLGPPLRPTVSVMVGRPIVTTGDPRNRADVRLLTDRIASELESRVASAKPGGLADTRSRDQT